MDAGPRQADFRRNEDLERLLQELNGMLAPAAAARPGRPTAPRHPTVLIMGSARSGTTLMLQWLAASGLFAYPSNLIARFYGAPYVGGLIQRMLCDPALGFRDEFAEVRPYDYSAAFRSDLGKTSGLTAPNVFWYFWRQHFRFDEYSRLADGDADPAAFRAGLADLEAALRRPVVMKGMIANWEIPRLDAILDRVVFLYVRRNPVYVAQSVLQSRERFFGDRRRWWSFKLPEYPRLAALPPLEQVAGQVCLTQRAVEEGLSRVAPSRQLSVDYEAFCRDPAAVHRALVARMAEQGCSLPADYLGPEQLESGNRRRLPEDEFDELQRHCAAYG